MIEQKAQTTEKEGQPKREKEKESEEEELEERNTQSGPVRRATKLKPLKIPTTKPIQESSNAQRSTTDSISARSDTADQLPDETQPPNTTTARRKHHHHSAEEQEKKEEIQTPEQKPRTKKKTTATKSSEKDSEQQRSEGRKIPRADSLNSTAESESSPQPKPRQKRPVAMTKEEETGGREEGGVRVKSVRAKNTASARGSGKISVDSATPDIQPVRHNAVIEDPTTGHFKTEQQAQQQAKQKSEGDKEAASKKPTSKPLTEIELYEIFVGRVDEALLAIIKFVTGLLSGFALLLLVVAYTPPTTREFLRSYGPIAGAVQRAFFVLTSLAALGSVFRLSRDKRKFWERSGHGLALPACNLFMVVCFLLSFALTLANIPIDDVLLYSEKRIPQWYENDLLLDGSYSSMLSRWHGCSILRSIACILGWLLYCSADAIILLPDHQDFRVTPSK